MSLALITAPTEEPIDLPAFMLHARVDSAEEAANVRDYIKAARELVETRHNRQMLSTTYDLTLDAWPPSANVPSNYVSSVPSQSFSYIELTRPPIQSVTHIKYYDTGGTLTTLASSQYVLDSAARPPRINLAWNCFWPSARVQPNAITVRFVAGYSTVADIPSAAKQLIREIATRMYDFRSSEISGTIISEFNSALNALSWNDAIFGYA